MAWERGDDVVVSYSYVFEDIYFGVRFKVGKMIVIKTRDMYSVFLSLRLKLCI